MTRRELAALAAVSAPAAAPAQSGPAEDLAQAAKAQVRANASALEKFKLDMAVEPAVTFRP